MIFAGNSKAIKLLERIIISGKLSQAYIFTGPESVGKFAMAKIFSSYLIDHSRYSSGAGEEIILGKKMIPTENFSPDLIFLQPEVEEKKGVKKEKKIEVEKIREVQKSLALYPYQGNYKVLIINNAHKLTESSQNAILKILEEPNPTTIIIFVTHEEGRLLTTVKSRCQKIAFNLVSPDEIKEKMPALSSQSDREEIINLSLGRPGLVQKIINDGEILNFQRAALGNLKTLSKTGINQRLMLAEKLAKNLSEATAILELWIWILHVPALKNIKLFKIIKKIEESLNDIKNTNANARLILENLLLNL